MLLFLIRHGETVDNVAGLYAGIRDSALTVQGNLQAERLGKHFATQRPRLTNVFSSTLQRAYKTANALLDAQSTPPTGDPDCTVSKVQLEILREQDFGFYEGKPFYARPRGLDKSGKEDHRDQHKDDADFQDVESKESMAIRANEFLDKHLVPILTSTEDAKEATVAIVSHGIMLSSLWRCFLKRFPPGSVSLAPGVQVAGGGYASLEHLGGWSNTGYLELDIKKAPPTDSQNKDDAKKDLPTMVRLSPTGDEPMLTSFKMTIKVINGKDHLAGLKRARGVGSSQYDEGQKKIESFFKKPKA